MNKEKTKKIVIAGLMAALCFVGYVVFPSISVTGTKIHLGNAFVVLAAFLLGGVYGGLSGAIGLGLADIISGYAQSAPRTFITKLVLGLIVGLIFHKIGKVQKKDPASKALLWSIIASVTGFLFNCVFEPSLKYVWYTLLTPNADKAQSAINTLLALTTYTTIVNSVINAIVAVLLYQALRPALKKAGI